MQAEAYKRCAYCGETFERNPHFSKQQWDRVRCCSRGCATRLRNGVDPSIVCCVDCGQDVPPLVRGYCRRCYARMRYHEDPAVGAAQRQHYWDNREHSLEVRRRWRERNPGYWKTRELLDRAAERGFHVRFEGLRGAVIHRDCGTCQDCKEPCSEPRRLHVHHIDGDPEHNAMENLIVLCSSCHAIRHYLQGDLVVGRAA